MNYCSNCGSEGAGSKKVTISNCSNNTTDNMQSICVNCELNKDIFKIRLTLLIKYVLFIFLIIITYYLKF